MSDQKIHEVVQKAGRLELGFDRRRAISGSDLRGQVEQRCNNTRGSDEFRGGGVREAGCGVRAAGGLTSRRSRL
jgi:hypothetical protein